MAPGPARIASLADLPRLRPASAPRVCPPRVARPKNRNAGAVAPSLGAPMAPPPQAEHCPSLMDQARGRFTHPPMPMAPFTLPNSAHGAGTRPCASSQAPACVQHACSPACPAATLWLPPPAAGSPPLHCIAMPRIARPRAPHAPGASLHPRPRQLRAPGQIRRAIPAPATPHTLCAHRIPANCYAIRHPLSALSCSARGHWAASIANTRSRMALPPRA